MDAPGLFPTLDSQNIACFANRHRFINRVERERKRQSMSNVFGVDDTLAEYESMKVSLSGINAVRSVSSHTTVMRHTHTHGERFGVWGGRLSNVRHNGPRVYEFIRFQ